MQLRVVVFVVAVAVGFVGCAGPKPVEFDKTDTEKIKSLEQEYAAAFNAQDLAKAVTYYSGGAVFMPPNSSTLRGQESIQGYLKSLVDGGATELSLTPTEVGGVGTLAYASGTFAMKTRPPAGGEETRERGKYLFLFKETANQWRCEYAIWNSDLPIAPAPPPADEKSDK